MILDEIEPWSDKRLDLLYAGLVAWIVNTSWKAPKEPIDANKFLPDWWGNIDWSTLARTNASKPVAVPNLQDPADMQIVQYVRPEGEERSLLPQPTQEDAERLYQKVLALNSQLGGRVLVKDSGPTA